MKLGDAGRSLCLGAFCLVAGCGGGGGGGSGGGSCNFIGNITSTDTGPQIQNVGAAGDGNLDTYASILVNGGTTQTATVRATASSGTFPAGSQAGAFFTPPSGTTANTTTINTYLGGALQESGSGPSLGVTWSDGSTAANSYVYVQTTKSFDAVEIAVTMNSTGAGAHEARVYELCSNGGIP